VYGVVGPITTAPGTVFRTVLGDIASSGVGPVLFHEHLISDASGWNADPDLRCVDADLVAGELRTAAADGVGLVVDATPIDFGRNIAALADVSRRSGVHVVAGTGLYREISYPPWLDSCTDEQLVQRFIDDVRIGIDGGAVRAGVIGEVGSSPSITPRERRVLGAAAQAQLATGAAILTHTQEGRGALEQLDLLLALGIDPVRVVVGHLDCAGNPELALEVARRGANVGYDRIGLAQYVSDAARASEVVHLIDAGYAAQVLLSGDQARPSQYRANGGAGFGKVLTHFVPLLRSFGVVEDTIELITVHNPRRILALRSEEAESD
jgi:phosphotriesterase-related protein